MSSPAEAARSVEIRCSEVRKAYGSLLALDALSLQVGKGEVVCLIGPSGSGKSTFLRTLNGLEPIDSGRIEIAGFALPGSARNLHEIRLRAGMVFQSFNLFPHLSVRRNLTLAPQRARGLKADAATALAERLLDRVHLRDQIDKYPAQLSGGQQQRVAIARALAMDPSILLFDEPTSSLDPEMVSEVLDVMRELASDGITMLVVTHEMGFARQVADRILFMDRGRIVADAAPADFFETVDEPRVRQFLSNIL